jgi:2-C-methyl-D-erythritol 2,4-cyclodiphosphate synthase
MRIGQGFDVHAFAAGRKLVIGGVEIPHAKGLLGHSDADVLLHAICDALLGAAGLGDIGQHYPDSSPQYADIDSRELLRSTAAKVRQRGYRIVNLDATIVAEAPRMSPHVARMIGNIASDLGVEPAQVNIKATTTEQLGFVGRDEGIAAMAVALID